jgi:hypothetical protein
MYSGIKFENPGRSDNAPVASGLNSDYIWPQIPDEVLAIKYSTQIRPISYVNRSKLFREQLKPQSN